MSNKNEGPTIRLSDDDIDSSSTSDAPIDSEVLPNYLMNAVPKDYDEKHILLDAEEDENEQGDPDLCESDDDAIEAENMEEAFEDAMKERMSSRLDDDSNENIVIEKRNMFELGDFDHPKTKKIKIHYVPKDWKTPPADKAKCEPDFQDVDNPGGWSSYSYRPVFKKEKNGEKKYKHHCLPTGCIPVPKNKDGKRIIDGWHFFYRGWNPLTIKYDVGGDLLFNRTTDVNIKATNNNNQSDTTTEDEDKKMPAKTQSKNATINETRDNYVAKKVKVARESVVDNLEVPEELSKDFPKEYDKYQSASKSEKLEMKGWLKKSVMKFRDNASPRNLFPPQREGFLDVEVLKKLGMNRKILDEKDFLFFYQLILPICKIEKSTIRGDGRLSYYAKLEDWSNLYAYQIGLGGSYNHKFENVTVQELLRHDGCVVRDGVRGGSSGAIYRRWQIGADYDDTIAMAQTYRRWLQIKRVKKLCNNDSAPKKGEKYYDPTYKYDYIFKCIVHNTNYLSYLADLDATIDETSFATASPGEAGAGVTYRVFGKPGISKGGQTVLLCDSKHV